MKSNVILSFRTIKLFCFLLLIASVFLLLFPITTFARKSKTGSIVSDDPVSGRIYTIISPLELHVNGRYRALDIEFPRQYWSNISTYQSTGVDWQEWQLIDYGTYWKIKSLQKDNANNRDNYLSIQADSANIGANAWVWFNCSGNGQRFHIEHVEGTSYYQFLTACSNFNYALGIDTSTHNVEQMSAESAYTFFYIVESSSNHGALDGKVYLQEYYSVYSSSPEKYLRRSSTNMLSMQLFDSSSDFGFFDWDLHYSGHGFFKMYCNDEEDKWYLTYSNGEVGVSLSDNDYALWTIEYNSTDDYYLIKSKIGSKYLSRTNSGSVQCVSTMGAAAKWRICFAGGASDLSGIEEFDKYDSTLIAVEDNSHSISHSNVFNYGIGPLYLRNCDTFSICHSVSIPLVKSDVKWYMSNSRVFTILTHGTINSELVLKPNNSTGLYFSINDLPNDLSYLQIGLFIACHSAEGSYDDSTTDNLVSKSVEKGAQCAIGFDGVLHCNDALEFIRLFYKYYSSHYGSPYLVAKDAFEYACLNGTGYHSNEFQPFYCNSLIVEKYDPSTNTCEIQSFYH